MGQQMILKTPSLKVKFLDNFFRFFLKSTIFKRIYRTKIIFLENEAIDFMLDRTLAQDNLALSCLNKKLNPANNEAYVRIHLNGSERFSLNVSKSTNFHLY